MLKQLLREVKFSQVVLGVVIVGLIVAAIWGVLERREDSSSLALEAPPIVSDVSSAPSPATSSPAPTPRESPTRQPISEFELRILDFMEAWHTEDPQLREQLIGNISTPTFREANPSIPTDSTLYAKVLNRHEEPRPMILSEPANRDDSVRFVSIAGVIIEKYDGDTFVSGFTAPTLSTVWVQADGQWRIDSQTYPFD
ncbi:hypothetical protein FJZ39_00295 [Candidatus Saccharibacteria bacterium]|nr:hypothetical protein [Candidatus Saccharibacteria bacterium]